VKKKKKKEKMWHLFFGGIYILFTAIYLVILIYTKKCLEAGLLALVFIFFAIGYKIEKKEFVNSEIQDKIDQLKNIIASIITMSLLFVAVNFIFNYVYEYSFLMSMVSLSVVIILCWIVTYIIGSNILTEINPKKKSLFLGEFIESIFESITNIAVVILVISYIFSAFYLSFEPLGKIVLSVLALILPTIKMSNFIISEYYEYERQEQAKQKQQKQEKYKYDFYNYE